MFFPAADTIAFSEGGVESMRIDSSGNVGIGTATAVEKLTVTGAISLNTDLVLKEGTTARGYIFGTSSGLFYRATSGLPHIFQNVGTELMRIDSSGNVGIGTSSPTSLLDVRGVSGSTKIKAFETTTSGRIELEANTAYHAIYCDRAVPLLFYTNGSERMRIDSNGYVLIGKTSEDNTSPGITLGRQESGTAPQQKMVKTFSGTVNAILNSHNGTYVGGMDFSNTATSFPTSSDIRLKTNVVDAGSASEKIDQIRIVSHGWKHDDSVVEFGVVAQELYAVAPQAVTKGDDGEEIKTAWGVDYSKLVPMLLKAHQEQQAIITSLTARIAALESK
jgi:hypothetical protein